MRDPQPLADDAPAPAADRSVSAVPEPTDEALMVRYRDGDAGAFDRLYARYRGPLYRYLARHCESPASADELYQETWLRVIRARARWRPEGGFAPWLFHIARNLLADHWRRRGPETVALDDSVVDLAAPWPEAWTRLRDCVERLLTLLAGLAREQRDAFLLQAEAGLSLEQIGRLTGVGRETVKSRLRYALRRLRAGLEDCDD
jgi:RNA polymerase sigma-70 factor (ECF subfamily)